MKAFLPVFSALLLAACASKSAVVKSSPSPSRYASPAETARLQEEARANFERERQRQGMVAAAGNGPAPTKSEAPRSRPPHTAKLASSRRGWSAAESRYAMQIGKSPSDLTAAERAAARME